MADKTMPTTFNYIPVSELRFGRVYVAQVSYKPSNPIHRVIAFCVRHPQGKPLNSPYVTLYSPGCPETVEICVQKLSHFAVERELYEFRVERRDHPFMPEDADGDSRSMEPNDG